RSRSRRLHLRASVRAASGDQRQRQRAAVVRAGAQRPGARRGQSRHSSGRETGTSALGGQYSPCPQVTASAHRAMPRVHTKLMLSTSLRVTLAASLSAGVMAADTEELRAARAYAECAAYYRIAADYAGRDKRDEYDQLAKVDMDNAA